MKRKIINLGLVLLVITLFIMPVSALSTIDIQIEQQFSIGEGIFFDYTITSGTSGEINYTVGVQCPEAILPLLELKQGTTPITETYTYLVVDETIEPQTCTAFVSILEPYELTEEKIFEIVTNPSFEFEINTCKDSSCSEKAKVFVKGENVFIDYILEVPEPIVITILTYPDKTTKQITLPTSIKANQIGTYELEVIASKENYKTITKTIQFGIIESEVEIGYSDFLGDAGEEKLGENKISEYLIYFLIGGGIFLITVIVILIILKRKK